MNKLSLFFLGLAVMLGLSMAAFGQDTITLTGTQGSSDGTDYTGIYYGTLNGAAMNFVCDDPTHNISTGQSWTATGYTLAQMVANDNNVDSYVGWNSNDGSAATVYTEEAYLELLLLWGGGSTTDPSGISDAIWSLMDSNYHAPDSNYAQWITQAANAVANGWSDDGAVTFWVPTSANQNGVTPQEFSSATPEPLSMALMGTFLSLAGLGLGRRKLLS